MTTMNGLLTALPKSISRVGLGLWKQNSRALHGSRVLLQRPPASVSSSPTTPTRNSERESDRQLLQTYEYYRLGSMSSAVNTHRHSLLSKSNSDTGAVLLVDGSDLSAGELLLQEADYPDFFINRAHPEDYKKGDKPIPVEYIFNDVPGHWRMILRVSFRLKDETFMPMSFVCDTGAPYDFYLSDEAMGALRKEGRLKTDDLGNHYLSNIAGKNSAVHETPYIYKPSNLIGMRLMMRLGTTISDDTFTFSTPFEHF